MAVSNSSADTAMNVGGQSSNRKAVAAPKELASASPALVARSERMLRWKSRENLTGEKLDDGHDLQQGNGNAASADCSSPKASTSTSQQGQTGSRPKPGHPYASDRPASPSRRAESVRRTASIDFDALQLCPESSANRLLSATVTSSVPSFHELFEQQATSKGRSSSQSPARRGAASVHGTHPSSSRYSTISTADAGPSKETKSKHVTRTSISMKPEERSQILKARKLLEFRSNVTPSSSSTDLEARHSSRPGTDDAFQDNILHQQPMTSNSEITADTSNSESYDLDLDLEDMAKEIAAMSSAHGQQLSRSFRSNGNGSSNFNSTMIRSPKNGFGNTYFFTRSAEKLRNQMLQGPAASEFPKTLRPPPRVLEFSGMPSMLEALQGNANESPDKLEVRENGHESSSPQVQPRSFFLERLHGERSGPGKSSDDAIALPATSTGLKRGEPRSESARFSGRPIPDLGSPMAPSSAAVRSTTSTFPHQSARRVLDSTAITSAGLSLSCRRLSVDGNIFEDSSNLISLGCRPSPSLPGATPSEEKLSSRNSNVQYRGSSHDNQRVSKSGLIGSSPDQSTGTELVVRKPKQNPRASSPAKSFKKWMKSQFQFGGNKKGKDGLDKQSTTPSDSSPSQDPYQHQRQYQLPALANGSGHGKASAWKVQAPAENQLEFRSVRSTLNAVAAAAAAAEFPAHPLPKPPGDSSSSEDGRLHHHDKKNSYSPRRQLDGQHPVDMISPPANPSGPQKFQGLQHLFATDASSSPKKQPSSENGPKTDSDGKPKRSMKFLECAEIADLNEFLRAKRDSVTSLKQSFSGYLKFIATENPTDLGSMISAICFSYYLEKRRNGPGRWSVVPLINFPRWKMKDHLDAAWLFNVCGLDVKALMFINEVDFQGLSNAGVTTRTMFVGEQVLRKADSDVEVRSCCTLLAETLLRDEDGLWKRSGSFLKTLLLAGLLMDTENLSKPSSSAVTSRDHQVLLNLATGAGPLGRFGLYERMRTVHSDPEVLKMAKKYYGTAEEVEKRKSTDSSRGDGALLPPPPLVRTQRPIANRAKLSSPKGSPLFSSETEDNSRSSSSPTSRSSSSERSRSNSPAIVPLPEKSHLRRSLTSLSRLPASSAKPPLRRPSLSKSGLAY